MQLRAWLLGLPLQARQLCSLCDRRWRGGSFRSIRRPNVVHLFADMRIVNTQWCLVVFFFLFRAYGAIVSLNPSLKLFVLPHRLLGIFFLLEPNGDTIDIGAKPLKIIWSWRECQRVLLEVSIQEILWRLHNQRWQGDSGGRCDGSDGLLGRRPKAELSQSGVLRW